MAKKTVRTRNQETKGDISAENDSEIKGNELRVVAIGASAGGLEAIESFFTNLPEESGMAFVVIQHLSPDYKSLMDELLARYTKMEINVAKDGMVLKANVVYLLPSKQNMTIYHNKLFLTEQDSHRGLNLPIDIFFRSLSKDKGKNSIGIILSGSGSDGTLGVKAIKEAGGMVMVQDEKTAKFNSMPRSAITTGLVDYILPPEKMPSELVKFVKHPFISKTNVLENELSKDEDALSKILKRIFEKTGVDFSYYKPTTIIRRLEKRISINKFTKIEKYLDYLLSSDVEVNLLYKELLIGVTQFFRNPEAFDILKATVFPALFSNKSQFYTYRIWSVGCSTGEEAYSLAMFANEYLEENNISADLKIFATDIDEDALETAGMGFYPESILSDVSPERLRQYFVRRNDGFQINEKIRRMIVFAKHNIIKDPPFSKIDLISCRNMLIYLDVEMQKKILSMFYFSLNASGHLFLGTSESLGDLASGYSVVNQKYKIYQYKAGYKPPMSGIYSLPKLTRPEIKITKDKQGSGDNLFLSEGFYQELILEFLPPGVLLNDEFQIIHLFKDAGKYLRLPSGKANLNILKMVPQSLSVVLSGLLHKTLKDKKEMIYSDFGFTGEDGTSNINILSKPLFDNNTAQKYIYISFIEKNKEQDSPQEKIDIGSQFHEQYAELERELVLTKENLQATIEELETSNEELQSTNEELIASNEELQSTNEELQSVNEELYTVNTEYQHKIDELVQLNNDINNLLNNTDVGTLFLDNQLKIRRYTPVITKLINIIEMDIGRPIHHLSRNSDYPNLIEDIEEVQRTLIPKEVEIRVKCGDWYLLRVMPYRTVDNAVEGIVITLYDVTKRKIFEEEFIREKDLLERILENSPLGKMIVSIDGKIEYVNRKAMEIFDMQKQQMLGTIFDSKSMRIYDSDKKNLANKDLPYVKVLAENKYISGMKYELHSEPDEWKKIIISGTPDFHENGKISSILLTIEY